MKLYTGIDFPINKCDNVGLPQFPAGAMENYGLILYKYQLIPYNEDTMTTLERVEAARVICHEVSHQWYGDLVTARWWDNLFLNEGFAAYYMRYLMGKSFPDDAEFVDTTMLSLDREQALKQDAGPTTHPLIAPDGPYFDKITYKKGSALLRMLSDVMGPEVLQAGVQHHLKSHEYGVASHVDLFASLTDGYKCFSRVFYDDESLKSVLEKIRTEDVPIGVKITLVGDEVALIERQETKGLPYSYDRLLNILTSVYNTPSTNDPSFTLADLVLPQMEFFASLLRDSIDAPLINRFFNKAFGKVYRSSLWTETTKAWNANSFKYAFLPYAVKHSVGDAPEMAKEIYKTIYNNCMSRQSKNGTSWCAGVPTDIHRAAYCGAAKYDNEIASNFASLMNFYNGEVQVNPYFFQEYRALMEGMACTERASQLRIVIRLFLSSPLKPTMLFDWLKANPKASDALYSYMKGKPESIAQYEGLSAYLDTMTYNWRSTRRLQQYMELHNKVLELVPNMNDATKKIFLKYEERIKKNIEWSEKHMPAIMRWMYDNLVVIGRDPWTKRLSGIIRPERYDVEITPYIPGSGKYYVHRNLTFDGNVKMTFTVTAETSEIVVNAHRLMINTDSVVLQKDRNERIEVSSTEITKDYENGILTIPVVGKLSPGNSYTLSISYFGFIFDKPFHQGADINYNFYEFNGKQGWIFTTDFEGGPGSRSLLVCCDEPSYKAKFKISVRHAADMTALSNMINTGTVVSKDGWAVTSFKESPVMSTYLLAICVGHFASLSAVSESGVLVRAFSWTGMEKYADFSLKVMAGTVDYMTKYFNYDFPLSKLDMVALPQHADAGAMENWGLILGNYKSLMVDMDYADANALGRVAIVLAHEVVHQWFGDLVTLDWWSDIFLNEGFAQYWSHYGMTHTLPEQKGYMEHYRFISTTKALINDCKENTWPILSVEGGLFTTAAYLKGSALLNTLSNTISAETLQKGLRKYISNKAYGNVKPNDLWDSLTKACDEDKVKGWNGKNLDVATLMKAWTTEKSFPILKVEHNLKTGKVTYNQESCLGSKNSNITWYIPVRSEEKGRDGEELNWFYGRDGSSPWWTMSYPPRRVDNVRRTAFVRMKYDTRTWASLVRSIHIAKDPITVGTILDDAWFFLS
ncbi:peptidase family M1 [Ancylostoma caninum]|uniref:Peptidase family M1 n=1 Tax=Ancylostoma caninum TaxID=29170 RepID=A0A368FNI4_ANCCA|nr:peptidase family M1 [Ancylostoma caninum]